MKIKNSIFFLNMLLFLVACGLWLVACEAIAQDKDEALSALTRKVIEVKTDTEACSILEEMTDLYFRENKYNEFTDTLKSLIKQKKTLAPVASYYIGMARYYQLKNLEEGQKWEEYFSQGNAYREEMLSSLKKTTDALGPENALNIYAKLIIWKFHKDQNDSLSEASLDSLMDSSLAYAKDAINLIPLKDVAGEFLSYGEKTKARELYTIYVKKLVSSDIKDEELNAIARGFYKEGNFELSKLVFDIYIERLQKDLTEKEKNVRLLAEIAKLFSYKDEGTKDPLYAEKIFKIIEDSYGSESFDQELNYLRGFNLEKSKEYAKAKDVYLNSLKLNPGTPYADELNFKIGIIYTYILGDLKLGKDYFTKLAKKEVMSPQVASALYQLGLLSQWEGDMAGAKEYYTILLEKCKDFIDTLNIAKDRLKEVEGEKSIEYNLKSFLDASLKEERSLFDMTKVTLKIKPYLSNEEESVLVSADIHAAPSGCMQVEYQYMWSGDTGRTLPAPNDAKFDTAYADIGTKVIYLVVVSPTGILDRAIDLLDVR